MNGRLVFSVSFYSISVSFFIKNNNIGLQNRNVKKNMIGSKFACIHNVARHSAGIALAATVVGLRRACVGRSRRLHSATDAVDSAAQRDRQAEERRRQRDAVGQHVWQVDCQGGQRSRGNRHRIQQFVASIIK